MRILLGKMFACALLTSVLPPVGATPAPDAATLLRDEVAAAPRKLGWKGPALADETRFAVAASGLSWRPAWEGTPLLRDERQSVVYTESDARLQAFRALRNGGPAKEAIPFALSLVLDPPPGGEGWEAAYNDLRAYGVDFDKALAGIVQAPAKLPLLPAYAYAAADVLVYRATPRLLPLFLTMADGRDGYLRSRAVAALGILAHHLVDGRPDTVVGCRVPVHEASLSAYGQRLIGDIVRRAANDKSYRVRAAAALAIGLMGDDANLPLLETLARDRAYVVTIDEPRENRTVVFPVRAQAAASLTRFGRTPALESRFSGKEVARAIRGGRDVTHDHTDMRPEMMSRVGITEMDW